MLRKILRKTQRQLPKISRLSPAKPRLPKFSALRPFRDGFSRGVVIDTSTVYPPPRVGSGHIQAYRDVLSRGRSTYTQESMLPARRRMLKNELYRDEETETRKQIAVSERLEKLDNDVDVVLERIRTASRRSQQSSRGFSDRPSSSAQMMDASSSGHLSMSKMPKQTRNFDEIERHREREVESALTQLPKRNIMTSLRKILGIVAHVTDKKVLRNWSVLKYGFIVHVNSRWNSETWKIRCDDVKHLFASFRGADAFRSGDMSRILRLLDIHQSKDEDLVSYVNFTQRLTQGGGEPENVDNQMRENSNTLRAAFPSRETLFRQLTPESRARIQSLPVRHRIALAKEVYESGMTDLEHWQRLAMRTVLRRFETESCMPCSRL